MSFCKRIILVLDSSGSMSSQKSDIIGGVNETIRQQRNSNPEENRLVFFNIVKFNDIVTPPTNHTLANVPFMNDSDYHTQGSTALFDAMGKSMDKYRNEDNVIMLIATDGQENASSEYTYKLITNMVKQFKQEKKWNFIYLSEDIDTFKQGQSIGIDHSSFACNNLAVGKGNIGSTMASSYNQECISKMRQGHRDVKLQSASKYTTQPNPYYQQSRNQQSNSGFWNSWL